MDSIMFSPYGYGPLPPSAIAEIEKKTVALRGGNFHGMLELGKKEKMERTQNNQASLPSSPPPVDSQNSQSQSLQVRRAESLSQQQNYLMLKAARRSILIPSLSIAIPQPADGGKRHQSREVDTETETEKGSEQSVVNEAGASVEPLQKQVKFLAPDEGEMSDQSSICQSPSWEGYGRRKKEKKKEAERRKKEKEQAEKEAKAAKRRLATRLSKSPPPDISGRSSRAGGLTNADRSMSDPLLISQYLIPETQPQSRPKDVERTVSADDLQRLQHQQPAMAEILSDSNSNSRQFVGGVKLDREREAALQNQLASHGQVSPLSSHHPMCDDGIDGQQFPNSHPLDGSMPASDHSSQSLPTRQEGRPPREMFPPSASRTPMLRQMSTPANSRSNGLLQGASKIFRGRDGKNAGGDTDSERGRHRDGYFQHQREQSTERSVAEAAYEQLVNSGSIHSSSTRSSSRHTQHTRRSSFTQEARSVALKLAGIKTTPTAKEDPVGAKRTSIHNDYFNYPEHSYTGPGPDGSMSSGAVLFSENHHSVEGPPAMSEVDLPRRTHAFRDAAVFFDRPATAQSSVSSSNPSVAGSVPSNQSKKSRSLRDAAKAALSISRSGPPSPSLSKSAAAPHYPTFRGRVESQTSSNEEKNVLPMAMPATTPIIHNPGVHNTHGSEVAHGSSTKPPSTALPKTTEAENHVGSRVSEGSSSSSAYEDGSPLPSPVTTPDTSRPQSSKDLPFTVSEITKEAQQPPTPQDDDVTLRQSSEGSSTSSTPRLAKSETRESAEMTDEDRWSRTAMPIDIDCDAQSFTTSFSNLDQLNNIDEALANASAAPQSTTQVHRLRTSPSLPTTDLSPENTKEASPSNTSPVNEGSSEESIEPTISIPPRSKKRDLVAGRSPTSPKEMVSPERDGWDLHSEQPGRRPGFGPVKTDTTPLMRPPSREKPGLVEGARPNATEEQTADVEKRSTRREKTRRRHQQRQDVSGDLERVVGQELAGQTAVAEEDPIPLNRSMTPDTGPAFSAKPMVSGKGINSYTLPANNPYLAEFPGTIKPQFATARPPQVRTSPPSPESPRFPRTASSSAQPASRAPAPTRMTSAPTPLLRPSSASSTRSSATLPVALAPVPPPTPPVSRPSPASILKQPARSTSDPAQPLSSAAGRSPMLSALPKHMQLQAGMPVRPPVTATEARMTPIAKMFVECCNCKFYHDMPSKLYECMAKPDAVVEDKLLGISGAITTMVKCPWCQHNMTTNCCAGYAAVVYLKEKLH